jgi:hypothetical protein
MMFKYIKIINIYLNLNIICMYICNSTLSTNLINFVSADVIELDQVVSVGAASSFYVTSPTKFLLKEAIFRTPHRVLNHHLPIQ